MNHLDFPEVRRHKDVVAFRQSTGELYAFHARNLQVAEITDEIWNALPPGRLDSAEPFEIPADRLDESSENVRAWETSEGGAKLFSQERNKFNLTLNVTQLCNLHCHYCAAGGDGTYGDPVRQISVEKTLPQIALLMDRLTTGGEFNITFLGGEPLLYPQALQAIGLYTLEQGQARGLKIGFQIITNGTLITESVIELLAPLKPTITLSLDGPAEINDLQRPQKNGASSTELAIRGLKTLLQHKSRFQSVLLHAVFNRHHTDVEKVWDFFQQFSVDKMEFTFDVTEKDENANLAFVAGLKSAARKAANQGGEKELRRIQYFDVYFSQLDEQYRRENHCGTGKSLLSLDARNQVFQCPLEVSFKDRLVGQDTNVRWERLKPLQAPLIELNSCGTCWARFLCGGGCLFNHESLTGDKHSKHVTYCIRTRHLLSEVLMYYKAFRETE